MEEVNKQQEVKPKMNSFVPVAIIGLIVIVGVGIILSNTKKSSKAQIETPLPTAIMQTEKKKITDPESKETTDNKSVYKDGEYAVVGEYTSPGGEESIDVKLTLKDDVIAEADVKSNASRPNSIKFQGQFIEGYKQFVVGKNIDEVKLDKVSGSSLTPKGFNDALDKVKAQAKA